MAEHRWTLLCKDAKADPQSGDMDLIKVVDEVHVFHEPGRQQGVLVNPGLQIVTSWQRTEWDKPERVAVTLGCP